MPPPQCPECGRFLSKAFMVGLADGPAGCPRCDTSLDADRFDPADLPASVATTEAAPTDEAAGEAPVSEPPSADPAATEPQSADPAATDPQTTGPAVTGSADASVRPPDLPPLDVEPDRDVLEGWDRPDADVIELLERRASVGGADPVAVIGTVLGAGIAGGLLGAIVARNNRSFGAVVGTLAGASGAVLGMRLFEDA